jgi:hypothetical protein
MAKVNIYVTEDLKRRMDQAEGVNWSPLACRAFEAKLAELITQRGAKDMQDVIMRLRASAAKSSDEAHAVGLESGRAWAMGKAEAHELRRLATADDTFDWDDYFVGGSGNGYGDDENLYFLIEPHSTGDRVAARDFWEAVGRGDIEGVTSSPKFLKGFVAGALEVWREVEDQL